MSPDVLLECPRTSFRDVLRVNVTERVWHSPLRYIVVDRSICVICVLKVVCGENFRSLWVGFIVHPVKKVNCFSQPPSSFFSHFFLFRIYFSWYAALSEMEGTDPIKPKKDLFSFRPYWQGTTYLFLKSNNLLWCILRTNQVQWQIMLIDWTIN